MWGILNRGGSSNGYVVGLVGAVVGSVTFSYVIDEGVRVKVEKGGGVTLSCAALKAAGALARI